jgi:hypothetical protein
MFNYYQGDSYQPFTPLALQDVIIESGYEDMDNLTFYPNVLKLVFTDNETGGHYQVLKTAFNMTPIHGTNYLGYDQKHSLTLYLNGITIFNGYIDKGTLEFDHETRAISFDVVDYGVELKNMTYPGFNPGTQGNWSAGIMDIYNTYKMVYPTLTYNVTNDINTFLQTGFNGIYLKHSWGFNGSGNVGYPDIIRYWDMDIDPLGYDHVSIYNGYLMNTGNLTFSSYLKQFALEMGMIIGIESYNKIYCVKRFGTSGFATPIDISGKIMEPGIKRFIHLKNIIGVRVTVTRNNNIHHYGKIYVSDGTAGGAFDYTDLYLDVTLQNGLGVANTNENPDGTGGSSTFRVWSDSGGHVNDVINGVCDPDLSQSWSYPSNIIGDWTLKTRQKVKERVEGKFTGINYSMAGFYNIDKSTNFYRPLTLKKNYCKAETEAVLLEANL